MTLIAMSGDDAIKFLDNLHTDGCWKRVESIKPDEAIQWWDQWACVISNIESGDSYKLTVFDRVEQKQRTFDYKEGQELFVRSKKHVCHEQ